MPMHMSAPSRKLIPTATAKRHPSSAKASPPPGKAPRFLMTKNRDRKSTRLNSSHTVISYAVFCLKKKKKKKHSKSSKKKHHQPTSRNRGNTSRNTPQP